MNTRCNIEKQNCLGRPSPNLDYASAKNAPADKRRGVICSIEPSPLRAQTIWVGTDDGLIHKSDDDGNYRVKLTVGDKAYIRPLVIRMDPRVRP